MHNFGMREVRKQHQSNISMAHFPQTTMLGSSSLKQIRVVCREHSRIANST